MTGRVLSYMDLLTGFCWVFFFFFWGGGITYFFNPMLSYHHVVCANGELKTATGCDLVKSDVREFPPSAPYVRVLFMTYIILDTDVT